MLAPPVYTEEHHVELAALMTVMDTMDVFARPDLQQSPDAIAAHVRAIYQGQDLPVNEKALKQAVALYLNLPQAPALPVVECRPAPRPEPAQLAPRPVTPTPATDEEEAAFIIVPLKIVFGLLLGSGLFAIGHALWAETPAQAQAHLAQMLVQDLQVSSPLAQAQLHASTTQDRLRSFDMQAAAATAPDGGTRLTLAHADPGVVLALGQQLKTWPAGLVTVRFDDQDVADLSDPTAYPQPVGCNGKPRCLLPINTVYVTRHSAVK